MKKVWYYCTVCDATFSEGEARVGGCGTWRCRGMLWWLEMSEAEYKIYEKLLKEIGVKEFAKRVRYKELQ